MAKVGNALWLSLINAERACLNWSQIEKERLEFFSFQIGEMHADAEVDFRILNLKETAVQK